MRRLNRQQERLKLQWMKEDILALQGKLNEVNRSRAHLSSSDSMVDLNPHVCSSQCLQTIPSDQDVKKLIDNVDGRGSADFVFIQSQMMEMWCMQLCAVMHSHMYKNKPAAPDSSPVKRARMLRANSHKGGSQKGRGEKGDHPFAPSEHYKDQRRPPSNEGRVSLPHARGSLVETFPRPTMCCGVSLMQMIKAHTDLKASLISARRRIRELTILLAQANPKYRHLLKEVSLPKFEEGGVLEPKRGSIDYSPLPNEEDTAQKRASNSRGGGGQWMESYHKSEHENDKLRKENKELKKQTNKLTRELEKLNLVLERLQKEHADQQAAAKKLKIEFEVRVGELEKDGHFREREFTKKDQDYKNRIGLMSDETQGLRKKCKELSTSFNEKLQEHENCRLASEKQLEEMKKALEKQLEEMKKAWDEEKAQFDEEKAHFETTVATQLREWGGLRGQCRELHDANSKAEQQKRSLQKEIDDLRHRTVKVNTAANAEQERKMLALKTRITQLQKRLEDEEAARRMDFENVKKERDERREERARFSEMRDGWLKDRQKDRIQIKQQHALNEVEKEKASDNLKELEELRETVDRLKGQLGTMVLENQSKLDKQKNEWVGRYHEQKGKVLVLEKTIQELKEEKMRRPMARPNQGAMKSDKDKDKDKQNQDKLNLASAQADKERAKSERLTEHVKVLEKSLAGEKKKVRSLTQEQGVLEKKISELKAVVSKAKPASPGGANRGRAGPPKRGGRRGGKRGTPKNKPTTPRHVQTKHQSIIENKLKEFEGSGMDILEYLAMLIEEYEVKIYGLMRSNEELEGRMMAERMSMEDQISEMRRAHSGQMNAIYGEKKSIDVHKEERYSDLEGKLAKAHQTIASHQSEMSMCRARLEMFQEQADGYRKLLMERNEDD